jgi:EAL domain-containing protein (putative c-di-GMP-specific phosphodiesterase class I)
VLIGVSIGAATSTPGITAKSLLAEADLAMYEAKRAGRGTFRFFEPRLQASASEKQLFEDDLRRGLTCKEIEINYKPVINLARNEVTSFEALVHWNHPQRGKLPYEIFTPIAEKCGLFAELGSWVLRNACDDAANWPRDLEVAVNVSPMQFRDPTFVAIVAECLAASGLPPRRLIIELTEPAFSPHAQTALSTLTELRALGVAVAFDNFGTGDCALSSLLQLPFDKIKIDRALLEHIDVSPGAAAVMGTLVRFGTGLGLTTAGQGVANAAQLHCLRGCGCAEAQGPFWGPARPNASVLALLRSADGRSVLCASPTITV